jgi:heme-degrading monooxygenase HmoA
MAILVTMQVGPVDWAKFESALDWGRGIPAPGRKYSRVYRAQGDPNRVLIVEEWDSHDSMHRYQDGAGEEFNRRAGTAGLEWQDQVWELADSFQ